MVEVRAHELDKNELSILAEQVVATVGAGAIVVVNGDHSVALASGAHGVHLRDGDPMNVEDSGSGMLTGQSVHSVESAVRAERAGADYVILGTIFPSASHPGGRTGGTNLVREVVRQVSIPVIGIGGITSQNARDVTEAGASGVAVIGAIIGSADPNLAARKLAETIGVADER